MKSDRQPQTASRRLFCSSSPPSVPDQGFRANGDFQSLLFHRSPPAPADGPTLSPSRRSANTTCEYTAPAVSMPDAGVIASTGRGRNGSAAGHQRRLAGCWHRRLITALQAGRNVRHAVSPPDCAVCRQPARAPSAAWSSWKSGGCQRIGVAQQQIGARPISGSSTEILPPTAAKRRLALVIEMGHHIPTASSCRQVITAALPADRAARGLPPASMVAGVRQDRQPRQHMCHGRPAVQANCGISATPNAYSMANSTDNSSSAALLPSGVSSG